MDRCLALLSGNLYQKQNQNYVLIMITDLLTVNTSKQKQAVSMENVHLTCIHQRFLNTFPVLKTEVGTGGLSAHRGHGLELPYWLTMNNPYSLFTSHHPISSLGVERVRRGGTWSKMERRNLLQGNFGNTVPLLN